MSIGPRGARSLLLVLLLLAIVLAAGPTMWKRLVPSRPASPASPVASLPPAALRDASGPLSMAAVGDVVVVKPFPAPGVDRAFDGVIGILQQASFAVTNLEETLRDTVASPSEWPVGPLSAAKDLRRAGFTIVTRANNHAADDGVGGIAATADILDRVHLLHTGAGSELEQAMAPARVGAAPRRVAVIAVTTSASAEARATPRRGEIAGRAGVATLRYTAEITADPATYAALATVPGADHSGSELGGSFRLGGRLVRKGSTTSVSLVADTRDVNDILALVASTRAQADVVVLSVHSHEPGNLSTVPPPFLREFSRQAIDRGATVVIGTGPRQLRGIEIYGGRPIFYSLGNFVFDAASIPLGAADAYDANTNLTEVAIEALGQSTRPTLPAYDEAVWWESVIATVTFDQKEQNGAARIRLQPIDLGADLPVADRGRPRLAAPDRGRKILQRLAELSSGYGTVIRIDESGIGTIAP